MNIEADKWRLSYDEWCGRNMGIFIIFVVVWCFVGLLIADLQERVDKLERQIERQHNGENQ